MNSASFPFSLLVTLLALALVLALAWFTLKFLAGLNRNRLQGDRMSILQSIPVGNRERVVLIRIDEHEYALGITTESIRVIDKLDRSSNDVKNAKSTN